MKHYTAKFTGRKRDSIGIFYPITCTVSGDDPATARLNLYDRFEHILNLELTEIPDPRLAEKAEHGCTDAPCKRCD